MNTFDEVHAILAGDENRRGWYDATCPSCGKQPKRGQIHFSYRETGGHCFVCGWTGNLKSLAELMKLDSGVYTAPAPRDKPLPPVARWRLNPTQLLNQYRTHPQRVQLWQGYKPLSEDTIERHDFGVGRLPFLDCDNQWYMSRSDWLIVPVYDDGALVALRGRNLGEDGPKWISASGSSMALWGLANITAGADVWICENYVDAAWLMQVHPDWFALAIGGSSTWRREWAGRVASRQPGRVIVALDNDLPGNGGGDKRGAWLADWEQEHAGARPPDATGSKIVDDLQANGVSATLFVWPDEAPQKAGIDWALQNGAK